MNNVSLIGRLTRDPEVRYAQSGSAVARYSIAVDRQYKRDGEPEADFINIVCFGKSAEFVEKYFRKGMKVAVTGRIQTGSYTNQQGYKVNTFDIVADSQEFCEKKGETTAPAPIEKPNDDGFVNVPEGIQEELPFINA